MSLRCLLREISRSVFFLRMDLLAGLGIEISLRGFAVLSISKLPESMSDGIGVIIQRQRAGINRRTAAISMRVVERCISHPHNYIGGAPAGVGRIHQAALATEYDGVVLIVDRVAYEIGSRVELAQRILSTLEFLLHSGEQEIIAMQSFRWRRLAISNC